MAKPTDLSSIDRQELEKELRRRDRKINSLLRHRQQAVAAVEEIDQQLRELGYKGNKARAGASRGRSISDELSNAVCEFCWGIMDYDEEWATAEFADELKKTDLTDSKHDAYLRQVVSRALSHDDRFENVRRGFWRAAE